MIFDSLILAAVADELRRALAGGKVERVAQPSPLELVLTLYARGAKHHLLLSADPQEARVHLTAIRRDNPAQPPPFCMLLRKYLVGAWLEDIARPRGFGERVLHLEFRAHDGAHYTLVAETMGKHSNVILVNAAGTILGALKHITREVNRIREIRPGLPYVPPPRQRGKRDPFGHFDPDALPPPAHGREAEWLMATFTGVSPLLAEEAKLRARPPLTAEALWYGLNEILITIRLGEYAPRLWSDDAGLALGAYPIPLLSVPARNQHPRDSISLALDNASASLERRDAFARAHDALRAALHKARRAREREREEVQKGLANADRADEYQQSGELLLADPHPAGRTEATLPDYYAPPNPDGTLPTRAITLDPTQDGRANAERYFKKARKARDSRESLQRRQQDLAAEIAALAQAEQEASAATSAEQLAAVRESVASSLGRPQQGLEKEEDKRERQAPAFGGHKIRTFRSPDGWEILVGENATANDYLTTRVAAPSDIWLHVRAATSAHGVIRAQGRPAAVSPAALQQAAETVAARSEVKHSSLIPVDYTLKKYVRKPRKSAPGSVTYQNEKTIYVAGIG